MREVPFLVVRIWVGMERYAVLVNPPVQFVAVVYQLAQEFAASILYRGLRGEQIYEAVKEVLSR